MNLLKLGKGFYHFKVCVKHLYNFDTVAFHPYRSILFQNLQNYFEMYKHYYPDFEICIRKYIIQY